MKCSLGMSNFLEEISSLSHSVVFLYFFALIAEEGLGTIIFLTPRGENREVEWPSQGCSTSEQKSWNSEADAPGDSLVVQSLGLCASTAGITGLIPGGGTKIPHIL